MAKDVLPVLFGGVDYVWGRLRERLAGLTAAEYLWEPVSGDIWTVRPVGDRWIADFAAEDPDPAPVTTIAWRLWHIADCLASYVERGPEEWGWGWALPLPAREWYAEVSPARAALETAHDVFGERVRRLGEDGIWDELGPRWGPYAESSWADLVMHAMDELTHHAAEVALLRDLYARR